MKRVFVLVFGLAFLVRLIVLRELSDTPFFAVLLGDAKTFHQWGLEIAGGDWFGKEVFYQAPLYPYFLGVVHALGGDLFVARLVQAVLAAIACVLVADAASRIFDRRTGLVAGLIAAVYAPAIWLEVMIQKTALAAVLTALLLSLLSRALVDVPGARGTGGTADTGGTDEDAPSPRRRRLVRALVLGAVIGLLALVRENAVILILPIAWWYFSSASLRGGVPALLIGVALVLAPVGARNAALGGTFLPTASNAGVNFYIGNSVDADGLYRPLVAGRGHALYERGDAATLAERAVGRELSPARVSAFWFERALDDIRSDPGRWARLLASKAQLVAHRTEIMDSESYESHQRASLTLRVLGYVAHFGCLLPLAIFGMGLGWRERRWVWPVPAAPLVLAAGIVCFFVTARFRVGVVPFLVPFAARGGIELVAGLRSRWRRRGTAGLLIVTAIAAVLANRPLDSWPLRLWTIPLDGDPIATTESNLASEYLRLGDPLAAYEHAANALEREPEQPSALFNLAQAAWRLDRIDEAEAAFKEAMRVEPPYATDCWVGLGTIRATNGDLPGALALFDRAIATDRTNAEAHYNRGLALRQSNRLDESAVSYLEAIRLAPDYVDAHNNLGFLRERQGRRSDAERHYRDALAIDPDFTSAREGLARVLGP